MLHNSLAELEAIEKFVVENPDWKYEDNRLKATFVMADFDEAVWVFNEVARGAAAMDHHPLITNVYNRLIFSLCTHSAGDTVTELDFELARRISVIVKSKGE
jgi:4a-hydroxytetrahydrobiopterin dehydratase